MYIVRQFSCVMVARTPNPKLLEVLPIPVGESLKVSMSPLIVAPGTEVPIVAALLNCEPYMLVSSTEVAVEAEGMTSYRIAGAHEVWMPAPAQPGFGVESQTLAWELREVIPLLSPYRAAWISEQGGLVASGLDLGEAETLEQWLAERGLWAEVRPTEPAKAP